MPSWYCVFWKTDNSRTLTVGMPINELTYTLCENWFYRYLHPFMLDCLFGFVAWLIFAQPGVLLATCCAWHSFMQKLAAMPDGSIGYTIYWHSFICQIYWIHYWHSFICPMALSDKRTFIHAWWLFIGYIVTLFHVKRSCTGSTDSFSCQFMVALLTTLRVYDTLLYAWWLH